MSEAYIINSMGQAPDLKMNPTVVAEKLRDDWHGIEVKEDVPGTYVLRWIVEIDGRRLLGGMQSDNQTITIDGGALTDIAELVIWYRKLVPEQYPLFLFKGSRFEDPIELSESTSKDELTEILLHY